MTTTTVPIDIPCPDWCTQPASEHVQDIWNYEGALIHTLDVEIADAEGWSAYGKPTRLHSPASVYLSAVTGPDGRESESAVMFIDGRERSVQQALALADEIRRQVELYRSNGGQV